ncbi:conserved hypothetical protein [Candidatus Methanoperedens nitroreducens]|uniref:Transcriptional regulator n=2 Tax=Candidatus Methanoperedens nitratireducens TaxID=1392998 RepID=A0A284VNI0_9EURY|nr:conserved hypothetical protein [Candidatus Methanoperedens nitroreducens]
MSRPIARVLSYLKHVDEATTMDIERGTGLRQPEVSIAMKQLKEYDWINEKEEKKPGKGRPYRIYSLKVKFNNIITQIEKQKKKAFADVVFKIQRLNVLGKTTPVG